MILPTIKSYVTSKLIDEDTTAVLLIGAWARGEGTDPFDVDLLIIKKNQLTEVYNLTVEEEGFHLDIWVYDELSLKETLRSTPVNINEVNNISLSILALRDAIVWFDKSTGIEDLISSAKSWTWKNISADMFDLNVDTSVLTGWPLNAVQEDLKYLKAASERINTDTPITHRKKDYSEIGAIADESKAKQLLELTMHAYRDLGFGVPWSELRDAKRALETGKFGVAVDSLKDVLRYMLRYNLNSAPQQLMDPTIWKIAGEQSISPSLEKALTLAYS